jgi:hypothetical protein
MMSGPGSALHGRPGLGWLLNPAARASIATINRSGMEVAADNNCFRCLNRDAYLRMLDRAR